MLALAACERFDDAPRRISRSFWDAVLANDRSAASALALAPDAADVAPPHALTAISLGRILRDEDAALVETTAVFADERPAVSFQQFVQVYWRQSMQKLNEEWKASSCLEASASSCERMASFSESESESWLST